jgi:DNA-directed RNA polymerase subunit RPC12/RpoP
MHVLTTTLFYECFTCRKVHMLSAGMEQKCTNCGGTNGKADTP